MEGITEMVAQQPEQETPVCNFATVGAVYEDGVTLIFDGEAEAGEKHYKCNTSVVFAAGDRVKILPDSGTYVVEYVVGAPAQPDTPAAIELDRLVYRSGSTVRTVDLDSVAFEPADNATAINVALGSTLYPWAGLYTGDGSSRLASTRGKVGFFGTTPIAKLTLGTTSNNQNYTSATASNYLYILNNIAGILKKYGLIG